MLKAKRCQTFNKKLKKVRIMNVMMKTYAERNGRLVQENLMLRKEHAEMERQRVSLIEQFRSANQEIRRLEGRYQDLVSDLEEAHAERDELRSLTLNVRLQTEAETAVEKRREKRAAELDFSERPVAELVGVCNKVPQKVAEDEARTIVKAMEASNFSRHEAARAAYWLIESRQRFSVKAIEKHLQGKIDESSEVSSIAECELALLRFVLLQSKQDDQKVLEGVKA